MLFLSGSSIRWNLLNAGFLVDQVPRGGWFGYQNLTSKMYTPDMSADFWAMGLQVVGLASLFQSTSSQLFLTCAVKV